MLQDKDRIFTNLYGTHSPGLEEARKRGAWHLVPEMLRQTPEWICDQIKASGLRGRGGAGFPAMVADMIAKKDKKDIYTSLVSSQLDADRLDYAKRDPYFAGVSLVH